MNRKTILIIGGAASLALIIGLGVGRYAIPSRSVSQHAEIAPVSGGHSEAAEPTIWTCSMHPQIQQTEPGNCPICGMDLIPLEKESGKDDGPRTMSMSESSRALADINTSVVLQAFPEAQIRLVGKLDYDETRVKSLTARFPARIDELFVNFTGVSVKAGEHLGRVYSPDLLTAQRELLTSHASDPDSSITRAARGKLRLWDLLPDQIDEIIERGEAKDYFVLRAPIGGVVVSKNVKEGDYLKTGDSLFKIVDLSELWLYLDAFESDLTWLRYGQDVAFTVESYPGEIFHGKIAFIEPEVDRKSRTISIRVNVSNKDNRLKPGMFSRGIVKVKMATGTKVYAPEFSGKWISPMHPEIMKDGPGQCDICGMDLVSAEELGYVENIEEEAPLIIPASSVLRTGKRAVVYVEKTDTERPTYEGREIVIGARAGDFFIVESGLRAGERVVTKGAFKIDSSLQIQAKPSMMNPEGGGPAPGHNHGGDSSASQPEHQAEVKVEIPVELATQVMDSYFALQSALASDDLEAAKKSVKTMMSIAGHAGAFPELLHTMLVADSLDMLRKPHFETLSDALIATVKSSPTSFSGDLLQMHCPMVYDDRGADWLQPSEPLRNPYLGAMMLKCGDVKNNLTESAKGHEGHAN